MGAQWKQTGKQLAANAKGKIFSKLAKEIAIAAKGGADPTMNSRSRIVEAAKKAPLPKDTRVVPRAHEVQHAFERTLGAAAPPLPHGYRPRRAETTALYRVVADHVETMLQGARDRSAHGFGLPGHVELRSPFPCRSGLVIEVETGTLGHGAAVSPVVRTPLVG